MAREIDERAPITREPQLERTVGHRERGGDILGDGRPNVLIPVVRREVFLNNQPRPEAVVLGRPPEGADYVRLPPLGAWSWSGPSFLPGTGRGFSVDDDFQAYPLSCESLPKP